MWETIETKWKGVSDMMMSPNNDQIFGLGLTSNCQLILWDCAWNDQPFPVSPANYESQNMNQVSTSNPNMNPNQISADNANLSLQKRRDQLKRGSKDSPEGYSTLIEQRTNPKGPQMQQSPRNNNNNGMYPNQNFTPNGFDEVIGDSTRVMQEKHIQPQQEAKQPPMAVDEFELINQIKKEHNKFVGLMEEKYNYLAPILHWFSTGNIKAATTAIQGLTEPVVI